MNLNENNEVCMPTFDTHLEDKVPTLQLLPLGSRVYETKGRTPTRPPSETAYGLLGGRAPLLLLNIGAQPQDVGNALRSQRE